MFITFEGIEGCGKSTQVQRISKRLKIYSLTLVVTFEPGGTRVGKDIRRILLDFKNADLAPLAELLLYEADRAQHVEEVIKPALAQGKWVLCDRFFDATVAYQGAARGQDLTLIRTLNEKTSQGIWPDKTFLLDCPAEIGIERALMRNRGLAQNGQDRFEREMMAFHRAVRNAYLSMAESYEERFQVIDALLPIDQIEEEIFNHIKPFLPNCAVK